MAPSKPRGDSTATDTTQAQADPTQTAAAVVDDNGQVTPDSPQAKATLRTTALDPRQYAAAGEGFQPGEAAPKDVWLDTRSDKVVTKQPEQGQVLAIKGSPVEPWAARLLADKNFKG